MSLGGASIPARTMLYAILEPFQPSIFYRSPTAKESCLVDWLVAQSHSAHTSDPSSSMLRGALTIAASVADVRRAPDATSERVTQALLQTPAVPLSEGVEHGWMHVRLPDYDGWIEAGSLAAPPPISERVAVVVAPRTPLYRDAAGEETSVTAYATSVLPLLDGQAQNRLHVALSGGNTAWVARKDVAVRQAEDPFPALDPQPAVALAYQLLGTPYLWGGVTMAGIDCSGLAQLCCRSAGRIVLRDADQQYGSIPYVVERGALRAGDLIFFSHDGGITHVALMVGAHTYIHAKGSPESRVMVNSLDPADATYSKRLADHYAGGRRPFPEVSNVDNTDA
jgi:gamma-D-glutamyl-L-lysine dipeptidyl-peptidase